MSTPTNSEYLLLMRGNDWKKDLSAEEMQDIATRLIGWVERFTEEGKIVKGQPLESIGRTVSGKHGRIALADGPFAESKEAVGGYFLLHVDSMEEAVALAQACPVLEYGVQIEVRPIAEECPLLKEAGFHLASVGA